MLQVSEKNSVRTAERRGFSLGVGRHPIAVALHTWISSSPVGSVAGLGTCALLLVDPST